MSYFDLNTGKSVTRIDLIREAGEAAITAARSIEEKAQAENRGFTPDEQAAFRPARRRGQAVCRVDEGGPL